MAEEKKGHVKITIDIEINERLMDVVKECMTKCPEMMKMWRMEKKEKE